MRSDCTVYLIRDPPCQEEKRILTPQVRSDSFDKECGPVDRMKGKGICRKNPPRWHDSTQFPRAVKADHWQTQVLAWCRGRLAAKRRPACCGPVAGHSVTGGLCQLLTVRYPVAVFQPEFPPDPLQRSRKTLSSAGVHVRPGPALWTVMTISDGL